MSLPPGHYDETLVDLLQQGDRRAALQHTISLMDGGMPLSELVLDVLAPAQAEIGRRWATGRLGVTDEALATEVADTLLTIAAARTTPGDAQGRLILCLAEREHHNLPARMIAELLRAEGFKVTFLGAPQATGGLPPFFGKLDADALLVSCSLAMNLPGVVPLARSAHEMGLPVIVGGGAFAGRASRAEAVGADAFAPTVPAVRDLLPGLEGFTPRQPSSAYDIRQMLAGVRLPLSVEIAERMDTLHAHALPRSMRAPRQLREDVRTFLLFLEAAVVCGEDVLTDYMAWFAARVVEGRSLAPAALALVKVVQRRLTLDVSATAAPLLAARTMLEDGQGDAAASPALAGARD